MNCGYTTLPNGFQDMIEYSNLDKIYFFSLRFVVIMVAIRLAFKFELGAFHYSSRTHLIDKLLYMYREV